MRFSRSTRLILAITALAAVSSIGTSRAVSPGPDSHLQPLIDGCQRSQSLQLGTSTAEWVYVYANDVRRARLAGDQVTGRRSAEGVVVESRPAGEDFYLSHDFHDYNVMVRPDPAYVDVLSTGNQVPGDEFNIIESEWETQEIPFWAWAAPGDRVRVSGNWIWDCGHWGNSAADPTGLSQLLVYDPVETIQDLGSPGAIRGENTEFHPMYELATYRADAAGILAAHGPRRLSRLDVWINGDGTPAHSIEECALRGIGNWALARVVCPQGRDVAGTYTYTMKLPPRPTGRSTLIVNPTIVHRETLGALLQVPISVVPDVRRGIVTVRFTLPHTVVPQRFGITVSAGWSDDVRPVRHVVTIDRIHITRSLDGDSEPQVNPGGIPGEQTKEPGDWVLYANVSGRWFQIPGIARVRDGQTIELGIRLTFFLPRGVTPRLYVSGHECDEPLMDCLHEGTGGEVDLLSNTDAGFNDRPGRIMINKFGVPMTPGTAVYRPPANPDPASGNENLSDAICGVGGCYQITATWTPGRS